MRSSFAIPKRYKQRLHGVAIELHRKWKIHLVAPAGCHASLPRSGLVQLKVTGVCAHAELVPHKITSVNNATPGRGVILLLANVADEKTRLRAAQMRRNIGIQYPRKSNSKIEIKYVR
jgi:hypothetical protein